MKKQLFFFAVLCLILSSCKDDVQTVVNVKLNPSFISLNEVDNEPMKVKSNSLAKMSSVTTTDSVIYAIQVYENSSPYCYGLFNDVSKMALALTTSQTYTFKITALKKGTGKSLKSLIDNTGTYYYLPNKTLLQNDFIKGDALKDIDNASNIILNGETKNYPEIDAFYSTKTLTLEKGTTSIDFSLLRMGFGVKFTVDALTSGTVEIYLSDDTIKLNSTNTSAYTVRQFYTATNSFTNIYSNADSFGDSIAVSAKWTSESGTTILTSGKYKFLRNYLKTINIQLNTTSSTFNFEDWANSITDVDGNVYQIVTIGTQTWMAENLKVTHYRDGTAIPNVTNASSWASTYTGSWCDYDNLSSNGAIYGHLYNIYVLRNSKNICPTGWHIPTASEFQILIDYLGGDSIIAGQKLIEAGISHWANETGATNSSGFTALPAGVRNYLGTFGGEGKLGTGDYLTIKNNAIWWTSTVDNPNGNIGVRCSKGGIYNNVYIDQHFGVSIRCIKD